MNSKQFNAVSIATDEVFKLVILYVNYVSNVDLSKEEDINELKDGICDALLKLTKKLENAYERS